MSSVPIPVISPSGISSPTYQQINNALTSIYQSIFGSDAVLTPDTQEGQWIAIISMGYYNTYQLIIALYNSLSPTFAQGTQLSALVKLNGLARLIASNSTAVVTIVGVAGTVINSGVVQDTSGNLWNLPVSVVIPGGGSISVIVIAQVQGSIQAASGTITTIYTPTLGWQTVTNPAAAVPGSPVETDAALRTRQAISTGQPAQTPAQSILAAVANIPGVIRSQLYENPTSVTDSNNIPSHSICVVVELGSATTLQVAQMIEAKKSPGTGTYGGTSAPQAIVVNDPMGLPVTINFALLSFTTIYVDFTIKRFANYVEATTQLLINNLVNFINNLPIGSAVRYLQLVGVVGIPDQPVGGTFVVTALTLGTAPSPVGTADLAIVFDHAAVIVAANVVVTET